MIASRFHIDIILSSKLEMSIHVISVRYHIAGTRLNGELLTVLVSHHPGMLYFYADIKLFEYHTLKSPEYNIF